MISTLDALVVTHETGNRSKEKIKKMIDTTI